MVREESILDSTDRSEGKLQVVKGSQVNAEKVNTKAKKQWCSVPARKAEHNVHWYLLGVKFSNPRIKDTEP